MSDQRTGAKPRVVEGVTFTCYRTGILRYAWRADDLNAGAAQIAGASTYRAWAYGVPVGSRFRSLEAALRAAVKLARKGPPSE